jgi:hypothetical protein
LNNPISNPNQKIKATRHLTLKFQTPFPIPRIMVLIAGPIFPSALDSVFFGNGSSESVGMTKGNLSLKSQQRPNHDKITCARFCVLVIVIYYNYDYLRLLIAISAPNFHFLIFWEKSIE